MARFPGRLGLLGLLFLLAASSQASQLILRSLDDLSTSSERIVMARCESASAHWNAAHTQILTTYQFRVTRTLKGDASPTLTLEELGGFVGRQGMKVGDVPRYTVGEAVLLFAARTEIGRWRTLGAGQGKFSLVSDPQGRAWVRSDFYRRELAQMSADATAERGAPLELFAGHVIASTSLRRAQQ
jgi:hypothetical protein